MLAKVRLRVPEIHLGFGTEHGAKVDVAAYKLGKRISVFIWEDTLLLTLRVTGRTVRKYDTGRVAFFGASTARNRNRCNRHRDRRSILRLPRNRDLVDHKRATRATLVTALPPEKITERRAHKMGEESRRSLLSDDRTKRNSSRAQLVLRQRRIRTRGDLLRALVSRAHECQSVSK